MLITSLTTTSPRCSLALPTDTGRMQPSNRGRAAPAAARERTGKKPGQLSSKSMGNKAGGKIQQQLGVMHSKLQHFQCTKRKTPDELTRDTAGELLPRLIVPKTDVEPLTALSFSFFLSLFSFSFKI